MGFRRPTTLVTFPEGHQFHGLEARCRMVSFERMLSIQELLATLPDGQQQASAEETQKHLRMLANLFGDVLTAWNLEEDDGTPVPATADQLVKEGWELVLALVMQWMHTVAGVDEALGKDSNSGGQFPAVSIPMETLSPNLPS